MKLLRLREKIEIELRNEILDIRLNSHVKINTQLF